MKAIINKTGRELTALIGLAQRENNPKRGYLLVNRMQAKHVPSRPGEALALFAALGRELYPQLSGRVTFIGFAETATAIGAHVAAICPGQAYYLQTTREALPKAYAVLDFEEEHSHATEQMLFCRDSQRLLHAAEQIVFVEDEISTGKTILNFIRALKASGIEARFSVASLLNGMSKEQEAGFVQRGIALHYLVRLDADSLRLPVSGEVYADEAPAPLAAPPPTEIRLPGRWEPRLGGLANAYRAACQALADAAVAQVPPDAARILVLGTEECMYPAICCAQRIEEQCQAEVFVHASSRSPILPRRTPGYPLCNRSRLRSMYDQQRSTFIYNLQAYDFVLVVTDAPTDSPAARQDLAHALERRGNRRVTFIRWEE